MKNVTTKVTKKADKKGSIQFEAVKDGKLPGIYIPRELLKELENADGTKDITITFKVEE